MVREGEAFGMTSLLLGEPRDATVIAVTEVRAWAITRDAFDDLIEARPQLWRELLIPAAVWAKLRTPRYDWLEPGELVVRHEYRHWLVLVNRALLTILLTLLYSLIIVAAIAWRGWSSELGVLFIGAVVLVPAFAWHWANWRDDYFVVTTWRVLHHERVAFFYESQEVAFLDRVQNVKVEKEFWANLLGYGNVIIETAAKSKVVFDYVPAPEQFSDVIMNEITRAHATRRALQRQAIREELAEHLSVSSAPPSPEAATPESPLPLTQIEQHSAPQVHPGRVVRALDWLAGHGLLPRTRIQEGDTITWRKHWYFLLSALTLPVLLVLLLGIVSVGGFFGWPGWAVGIWADYPYLTLIFTILCMGWIWWEATDWTNDIYTVTNERIIDVDQRPFALKETRKEASLEAIQNVMLKVPNFVAASFNYGDVMVQTAGSEDFTFDGVPNPLEVQREIMRRAEAFRERQRQREAARRRAEMAEWFSVYREMERREAGLDAPSDEADLTDRDEGGNI
jgi:uncharacterized membrane protein YdbT with pleckstrin-like domain